jgi:hypothetical protein
MREMRYEEPALAELRMPDLLRELALQTATLVRQEMELARAEITQKGEVVGKSASFFATTTLFGLGAFGTLTIMLIAALALVMPIWASALVITVVYAAIASVAALLGKSSLKAMNPVPEQTLESVRGDVNAVRTGIERGR